MQRTNTDVWGRWTLRASLVLLLATAAPAVAGDRSEPWLTAASAEQSIAQMELRKSYALGINRFDLDVHTEIIGWRLSDTFYFGRQDGLDSGLTLVWQGQTNQVSLSKDGVRLTRRF